MSFFTQLEKICEKEGIKVTPTLIALGKSKGNIDKWRKGGLPNGETLVQFCEHFNVSADYFLFGKDSYDSLSEEEQILLDLIRNLTHEQRLILKGFILGLMEQQPPQASSVAADDIPPEIAAK